MHTYLTGPEKTDNLGMYLYSYLTFSQRAFSYSCAALHNWYYSFVCCIVGSILPGQWVDYCPLHV